MKEMFLNLENEVLSGNVLDIGFDNYGIVYNMYKHYNEEVALEYCEDSLSIKKIKNSYYNSCIMMFTINNILTAYEKSKIINSAYKYLKPEGILIIWDYEKPFMKVFRRKIKIMVPNRNLKEFKISNLNFLSSCSEKSILKLLEKYFEVVFEKHSDEIYCIKAKKKVIKVDK